MHGYSGTFAGIELAFGFQFPDTAKYYGKVLTATSLLDNRIKIPEKDVREWMKRWNVTNPAYSEYVMSCSYACDRLMKYRRIIFHGASFLWNGSAYIFSAPSGTGKTTQLRLWQSLFHDEIMILNGDKPILEVRKTGETIVHPSPWKGKEGYGRDDIIAPLGGIILLRQAEHNSIYRIKPAEAARNLFGRNYSTFSTEEDVLNAAIIMNDMLSSIPVWLLQNKGDEESVRITYQTLLNREER